MPVSLSLEQMHADKRFDDALSGTTAISILLRGKTMFISNVGDSRAIVISSVGDRLVAKPLSVDQTPYRKVIPLYLLLLCMCVYMYACICVYGFCYRVINDKENIHDYLLILITTITTTDTTITTTLH